VPSDPWVPTPTEVRDYKWALFPEWHASALCRTIDKPDEVFFGERDDSHKTSLTVIQIREVKSFCRQCPVFQDCLEHALTTPERHGIWAGTSKRTRLRILALVDLGEVTITEVIDDYLAGRERKYESIRR